MCVCAHARECCAEGSTPIDICSTDPVLLNILDFDKRKSVVERRPVAGSVDELATVAASRRTHTLVITVTLSFVIRHSLLRAEQKFHAHTRPITPSDDRRRPLWAQDPGQTCVRRKPLHVPRACSVDAAPRLAASQVSRNRIGCLACINTSGGLGHYGTPLTRT